MEERTKHIGKIRLDHVTVRRAGRAVLEDLTMRLEPGRTTAVMGPSGSGKTTVLKLVTGQLTPDAGRVWVDGRDLATLDPRELNRLRRHMGVLLQNGALFTDLTCFDNVALPMREHTQLPEPLVRRLVLAKLQAVGLRGAADLYPRELSGGMARRVATARALALDPSVMLYDEPFAGLDPISLGVTLRLVRELNTVLQMTSLVTTHDVARVDEFAHDCYLLANGRVVASGTPQALGASDDPVVRQFLSGLADGPVPFHYPARSLSGELLA